MSLLFVLVESLLPLIVYCSVLLPTGEHAEVQQKQESVLQHADQQVLLYLWNGV